jgi:hypothetical protein
MRERVEAETGAPCTFTLGACGELGPRRCYTDDPAVADRNGEELAYASLSALSSMPPPETDYHYAGAVVSGATLGTWADLPFSPERSAGAACFAGGAFTVELPLRPLPNAAQLDEELAQWEGRQQAAEARGDLTLARDCRARAERARRWLGRLGGLPSGPDYALPFTVYRMGDALWVSCAGEPYSAIQAELRRRFPQFTLVFSPLAGGMQVAYLLPRDRYGLGLYQEEPSLLAPGCLEQLTEAIAAWVDEVVGGGMKE